jgi:RNA polymerase sigma-70 factor (ECF subfamily)
MSRLGEVNRRNGVSTKAGKPRSGEPEPRAWEHRQHLLNVAYRLLGSVSDAEDAVQEAYIRLLRTDAGSIDNERGWLAVTVTRLCLDQLRSSRRRHETDLTAWFPEPIVHPLDATADPADLVTLDDSVRMALLILLEQLSPAERVVFVLHDVFEYSFEEIAPMVDRTPAACRQLGSRARRRIQGDPEPARYAIDEAETRRVVARFLDACRLGRLEPLLEVLDPEVVGWADLGEGLPAPVRTGREAVAMNSMSFFGPESRSELRMVAVNGEPGIAVLRQGRVFAVLAFEVRDRLVTAINAVVDEHKLGYARHVLETNPA